MALIGGSQRDAPVLSLKLKPEGKLMDKDVPALAAEKDNGSFCRVVIKFECV